MKNRNEPRLIGETLNSCTTICEVKTEARSPAVRGMLAKYGSIESFGATWKPAKMNEWALTQEEKCMLSTASPTLGMVEAGYGIKAAVGWLAMQLMSANQLLGLTEERRLDGTQSMSLAAGIIKEWPSLKVSELWVFLRRWLTGAFGKKVYGSIDPTEMGGDIGKFIAQRREMEVRRMRKEATEKAARDSARIDAQIKEYSEMVGSQQWAALPEDKKRSVSAFLRLYGKL